MGTHLVQEFCRFCRESKRLRQLLRDTRRCFRDINSIRGADGKRPCSAQLSEQENVDIESNINKVPCLIVLGQTCAAKVHVVNQIFQQVVLPLPDDHKEEPRWRTVCFRYSSTPSLSLSLPGSFELVNDLMVKEDAWKTISAQNLELRESESDNPDLADGIATLEVKMRHLLLKDGGMVAIAPSSVEGMCAWEDFGRLSKNRVPVVIYAIARNKLSEQDLLFLRELLEIYPDTSVFFIKVPDVASPRLRCNRRHDNEHNHVCKSPNNVNDDDNKTIDADTSMMLNQNNVHIIIDTLAAKLDAIDGENKPQFRDTAATSVDVFQQLLHLGFLSPLPRSRLSSSKLAQTFTESGGSSRATDSELVEDFAQFPDAVATFTHQVLEQHLLRVTNLLHLVHTRTLETFILVAFDMSRDILVTPRKLEFAREREGELYESLMQMALLKQDEIQNLIAMTISDMREELLAKATDYEFIGVNIPDSGCPRSSSDLKVCSAEIQDLMLGSLNRAIAGKLLGSVDVLRDSYTGVLTRCLRSLEETDRENTEATRTTEALKEILNSAYQVEITVRAGASFARVLLEKMKQLMHSMPWRTSPLINNEWKRKVATDMLNSLRETRLAKSICSQIKDHLRQSHDTFTAALKQLEARHSGRLERTEEQRLRLRKCYAPRVARLVLESTSLRDSILFGMPVLGREVGRGQYGVVYSCESWAGIVPCAIKTVVPPDDRHWNDLALEFYYTKNVPEHDRIVALRGAIIDTTFSLASPAVLLVMDRLQRDLYVAIKTGLDWLSRLQVAIDVVEGIRYLHSLGLVHRDIKLKNVLLDKQNRGKITDLGFCKPEAMMSGSIVGTPIHMAPELFTKRYDSSVDVYAFGILFWYVCSGHTQLPYAFEQCQDKEMLWTSVKRGIRPERLQLFQPDCWELMNESWDGNPSRRPLLGDVEVKLRAIYRRNHDEQGNKRRHHSQRLSTGPLPLETGLSTVDMDSI